MKRKMKTYHRDDVGNSISRVNNGTSQGTCCILGSPRGGKGEHGLDGNVKARNVECLEHDLGSVLTVLGRVERRFGKQEVVVLGLYAEVLEHAV